MENDNLINNSSENNNNNTNSNDLPKSFLNLNDLYSCENTAANKTNNSNKNLNKNDKVTSENVLNDIKLRTYSSEVTCNLRSSGINSPFADNINYYSNKINNNLQKKNSFVPNKDQINKFNSVVRKSCFTKFDIMKQEKKQSLYIDEEMYQSPLKSKQEKEQIRKELIKDLFRRFGKTKKIKSLKLNEAEEKEITESEQNKNQIEFNFKNLFLYPTEVLKQYKKINPDADNNPIKSTENFNKQKTQKEEDEDLFLKNKIEEIQTQTKNEKEKQEKLLMLKKQSEAEKAENTSKKRVSIFFDSGKYKNKWFSKMTEDEYDDFIIKTKSEHLQKLSKIRSNKKPKALDFDAFLKEKLKLDIEKKNETKENNSNFINNDINDKNKKKNNENNFKFLECIENKSLDQIHEESKSSRFSAYGELTADENFKNILNAQSLQEKEISASYIFGSNNILVKKENENKILFCASKTMSKNKSKSKNTNNFNGTMLEIGDISKNSIDLLKKKKFEKENTTKSKAAIENGKIDKSNPLKLIKFDEKEQSFSASVYLKRVKKNKINNNRITCADNNFNIKNFNYNCNKKSKYMEKKEKLANFKKFEKLKKLSYLVANVKSNHMRNIKVDFIIQQQKEKEKKEKLLREYLEEENKLMESNNIENENIFIYENHITQKNNKEILSFVRYKDIPKLDSAMLQNTIFQSKLNQINYLQDSYLIPDFRNKFIRYPENYEEILVNENLIEKFSRLLLNFNKQVYQKDLDQKKKLEVIVREKLKLDENIEFSGESNFIRSLRDRKNNVFQENLEKLNNRNYEFLNSFKFKYNRKKIVEIPNEKIKNIIDNSYEINMFEKEDKRLLSEYMSNFDSKIHSEDFCLSNGNNREENLQKFLNCYGINVE